MEGLPLSTLSRAGALSFLGELNLFAFTNNPKPVPDRHCLHIPRPSLLISEEMTSPTFDCTLLCKWQISNPFEFLQGSLLGRFQRVWGMSLTLQVPILARYTIITNLALHFHETSKTSQASLVSSYLLCLCWAIVNLPSIHTMSPSYRQLSKWY